MTTDRDRVTAYPPASWPTLARAAGRYPDGRFLDDLAILASRGRFGAQALIEYARDGANPAPGEFDAVGLSWFAYVVASRAESRTHAHDAARLFALGYEVGGHRAFARHVDSVRVEASHLAGVLGEHRPVLTRSNAPEPVWWGTDVDAQRTADSTPSERWLEVFNKPLLDRALDPIAFEPADGRSLFDRLSAPLISPPDLADLAESDGSFAKISVVVPVYNPGPSLRTAVHSILAQSWPNLEVILCDDASTDGLSLIDELRAADERIRVSRAKRNGGAYAARNRGLALAHGEYVTFNDADDWSHPRRLERQLRALRGDPRAHACVSWSIRLLSDLRLTVMGRPPTRVNLSSILFRRLEVRERLGGFDRVRKGADSEFVSRFRTVFGDDAILDLEEPLAVVQLTTGSLSRDDYRFLRTHPARLQYMAAFRTWHRHMGREGTSGFLPPGTRAPFPAPDYISGEESPTPDFDVVVLASLDPESPAAVDLAGELQTMAKMGLAVGVVEYLGPFDLTGRIRPVSGTIADLAHRGAITRLLPGESARARIGIIRDPAAVETMPAQVLKPLQISQYTIIADYSPAGGTTYDPVHVTDRIEGVGAETRWVPATSSIRTSLVDVLGESAVAEPTLFGQMSRLPAQPIEGKDSRAGYSHRLRVGLAMGSTYGLTQDEVVASLEHTAPRQKALDLVTWGVPPGARDRFRRPMTSLDSSKLAPSEIADLLDVAVVAPARGRGAHLDRFAVAAMARGCVTILDGDYRQHFGKAALYLDERDATEWLTELTTHPELLTRQQSRGWRFVRESFAPAMFEVTMRMILSGGSSRSK